jgi:predicted lipoprotein with Yx(FWY)xxD motif
MAEVTITVGSHPTLGDILTDGEGRTLYLLTADPAGQSVCTGDCAEAWPPLTVESEDAVEADPAVEATLETIEREDGTLQVAADGTPLYYWVNDEEPGDATGQEVNNVWFVLRPDASPVKPTISVRDVDSLGAVVTDADGMTLYILTADPEGESVCTGDCAEAWPPLTVESEDALVESVRADGTLGTTEREDGMLQVTIDGMPLYYFVNDEEPGDATGQEVNNVWFALRPDASVLKPTVSVREHDELGPILTDADGMTLYLFTNDEGDTSNCTGGCSDAWPPHTVESQDALVQSVRTDVALGTIEHPEAGTMVTAAGHPLYYFAQDEEPGDANGQGVNDVWFVLDAEGNAVGM